VDKKGSVAIVSEPRQKVKTSVIVPAYNEEEGILVVLGKLLRVIDESYEVIVVDDGSTDRTAELARQTPCRVVSYPINHGKSHAVRTGIRAAIGDKVIVIDADDTYPVEVVPQIVEALNTYDMVTASRAVAGITFLPLTVQETLSSDA
jgi:glycosyltransferase involved in cell wall biosynthesis